MKYIEEKPAGLREIKEGIVEVKIWEAFLLYNRDNLCSTLSAYALNNGLEEKTDNDLSTVTFRFTTWDWSNTLRKLLSKNNIPVISEVTRLKEDSKILLHA